MHVVFEVGAQELDSCSVMARTILKVNSLFCGDLDLIWEKLGKTSSSELERLDERVEVVWTRLRARSPVHRENCIQPCIALSVGRLCSCTRCLELAKVLRLLILVPTYALFPSHL